MIVHRIRIANYRGITASDVTLGLKGITLVQGPNEVGKSSLGEAIRLLFEYPDSSKAREIEEIRPTHRDEGPEIELQAEAGPYTFTYFKRYCKKPETRLVISRPKPENHTGRSAHERAEVILRETLDINLWKALAIQQGDAIAQPDLTKQTSLSAALDKAAGGRPSDPGNESLFDRVREEYGFYFTERGIEKKELQDQRKLQEDTRVEVEKVEQNIGALEQDVERAAALQQELVHLEQQKTELENKVSEYTASLEEISTLENALGAARLKLESAQMSERQARADTKARQELIDAVANATKTHADLQESKDMLGLQLKQVDDDFKKAQQSFDDADERQKGANTLAALRRMDFDYYTNKLDLELLRERKTRIDGARKDAAHAENVLARNKMDSHSLKSIQDAERALLITNAQLETGAPSVQIRGLEECELQINGSDILLGKGEARLISVSDKLQLTVPEALDIEFIAGSSTEVLTQKVAEARRALETACRNADVADPEEATKAFEEQREAIRHVEVKVQVGRENLRDLTYEQLEDMLLGLEQIVPNYLNKRAPEPAICPNLESAKKEWVNAETVQKKTNEEYEVARNTLDAARNVREALNTKYQMMQIEVNLKAKELQRAGGILEGARKTVPDDELESNFMKTARDVLAEDAIVRKGDSSLKAKNPERMKALADTAKGSLQRTQDSIRAGQTEQTQVLTRLTILGEEGLHEKLNDAKTRLECFETTNRSLFRRVAAAKQLFETMRNERDNARRAYVAPLRERIEHLGRLVFDETFQIDINDELRIASRTVDGRTVPFDSLSGGTKEQLSLIFRLACSMIVAGDGATPLIILDDALGYTDPERLQLMGTILAKAAKECQIVIFTCVPNRYSHVGKATVVTLS